MGYSSFNVPLFAGGGTSSRVREAVYLHRAAREQLQRVTRETERQARDAYLGVLSEKSRVKALEQAVASSRTALEATAGRLRGRHANDRRRSEFAVLAVPGNHQLLPEPLRLRSQRLRLKQAAGTLEVQDLERNRPVPDGAQAARAGDLPRKRPQKPQVARAAACSPSSGSSSTSSRCERTPVFAAALAGQLCPGRAACRGIAKQISLIVADQFIGSSTTATRAQVDEHVGNILAH